MYFHWKHKDIIIDLSFTKPQDIRGISANKSTFYFFIYINIYCYFDFFVKAGQMEFLKKLDRLQYGVGLMKGKLFYSFFCCPFS